MSADRVPGDEAREAAKKTSVWKRWSLRNQMPSREVFEDGVGVGFDAGWEAALASSRTVPEPTDAQVEAATKAEMACIEQIARTGVRHESPMRAGLRAAALVATPTPEPNRDDWPYYCRRCYPDGVLPHPAGSSTPEADEDLYKALSENCDLLAPARNVDLKGRYY